MKNVIIAIVIAVANISISNAQNLLSSANWTVGNGSIGDFYANGDNAENTREWGVAPNGQQAILWKASPDGATNADGGWESKFFPINHERMYRFCIWLKKTNSHNGVSYLGCNNVQSLDNLPDGNPYFWNGDLPELDKWYLVVGFIHASNDQSTQHYGGIYDGSNGQKVAEIKDFKFAYGTTEANFRTYLYYDPNTADRQFFYAPRVDMVNGEEPAVETLIGIKSMITGQNYFSGNVGIGTTTPAERLSVNGKIRAKEIKVEASNWPDYVFEEDHKPMLLTELEAYIRVNRHLPEIPSAKEVADDGISLGEMNKLLLKKIEELTLMLIGQNKSINAQAARIEQLEKQSKLK